MIVKPASADEEQFQLDAGPPAPVYAIAGRLQAHHRRVAVELLQARGWQVREVGDPRVTVVVLAEGWVDRPAGWGDDVELIDETELWQRLGLLDDSGCAAQPYTLGMLSQVVGKDIGTLRRWVRRGLLQPCQQVNRLLYFDFSQVVRARTLAKLFANAQGPGGAEAELVRMTQRVWRHGPIGDTHSAAPQPASVSDPQAKDSIDSPSWLTNWLDDVVIDGQQVLLRRPHGLMDVSGQLHLNFYDDAREEQDDQGEIALQSNELAPQVLSFPAEKESAGVHPGVDEYLRRALELEDSQDLPGALQMYRAMVLQLGPTPDICFAMAELLYGMGDLPAARERYYMALELETGFVEAWASLGCLLVELGERAEAQQAFETALRSHPDYADVHFHLARLLDLQGADVVAEHHWRAFLRLAPQTPWSEEARIRLTGDSDPAPSPLQPYAPAVTHD